MSQTRAWASTFNVSPGAWFGDLYLAIAKGFGINNLTTFGEHGTAPLAGLA